MANWEQEAASQTAAFVRRELGLCPQAAEAERRGGVLTICLAHALSPLGRLLVQTAEGVEALETVYALLHEIYQAPMEALITRIAGTDADHSRMTLDCERGDIRVSFRVREHAKKED